MWVVPAGIPSGGGYTINNAIWLDGSADYLTNTFAGAGNNKTGTVSFWIKRNETGATHQLFHARSSSGSSQLNINSSNVLYWRLEDTAGAQVGQLTSTQVVRDLTAWMHVVVNFDTTNGTAGNRMRMYVNGSEVTDFSADVNPSLNADSTISDAAAHYIGATHVPDSYADCYLAEYIYIDGTQLDASSFGETDAKGNWVPVDPSGLTFGTNGFWLDFAVAPGTGNGAGTDVSGNGNHWTDTSLTASQQVEDSPTDSSADNVGNYATLNPLSNLDSSTISNGNLTLVTNSSNYAYVTSTQAMPTNSGIYWFKTTLDSMANGSTNYVGIVTHSASSTTNYLGADADAIGYRADGLTKSNGANVSTSLTTCTTNDVIYMKVDTDADTVAWYKNDTSTLIVSESIPSGAVGKPLLAAWGDQDNASTAGFTIDFGTGGFSIPDGQYLNTANLPAPTVTDPSAYFQSLLYTGNSSTQAITGFTDAAGDNVTPDLVWLKCRDQAFNHQWFDVLRGVSDPAVLAPNLDDQDANGEIDSFDSGGFTLTHDAGIGRANTTGDDYVAWCMKFGGAGVSNTDGTENSTVSVAAHGGAALVKYQASATPSAGNTVGHGMTAAPEFIIAKARDRASQNWEIYHKDEADRFYLNTTAAASGTNVWNSTAPSTSVVTLSAENGVNGASSNYIMACFARTSGLIGIGSYTGNGSADGPYVVVDDGGSGFRPAWVIIKRVDSTSSWTIYDAVRSTYNPVTHALWAEATTAESPTADDIDFVANGFKPRSTATALNASGGTYVYISFAEYPFGGSGVAQARAR